MLGGRELPRIITRVLLTSLYPYVYHLSQYPRGGEEGRYGHRPGSEGIQYFQGFG